jgi:hypothetical protein
MTLTLPTTKTKPTTDVAKQSILLYGVPKLGKCLGGDSVLYSPTTGQPIVLQELVANQEGAVLTMGMAGVISSAYPSNYIANGEAMLYRVTTQSGRTIEATAEHPFLTREGWAPLSVLKENDKVGVVAEYSSLFGAVRTEPEFIKVLAYLLADGSLGGSSPVFTKVDEEVREDFKQAVEAIGDDFLEFDNDHGIPQVRVKGGRIGRNNVLRFIREHGIAGLRSGDKFIPDFVFGLQRERMALFLNRLFSCDGSIEKKKVSYSSKSIRMVRQVQHLLLRFGIVSLIRDKYIEGELYGAELYVAAKEDILRFIDDIGVYGEKQIAAEQLRQSLYSIRAASTQLDRQGNILFDRIKSIVPTGTKQIYDLTIPDTHNFVANDFVVHNSSFASQFPEAMFFECEPGLNHLEVFKVPTYSWEAFLEACKLIAKGDHNFKTIVIDTVDNAFKMCSDHVCAKHGIEYEGDMGHGKGWALVKNEWHRVLTRLASLPYGLILISHAVDKTIETRTGEYTKTTPSLPDRARNVVLGLVDIILYGDSITRKDPAGNIVVERVLRTKPHPTYEAGDRTGRLPEMLPLEYAAFQSAFVANDTKQNAQSPAPGKGSVASSSTPGSTPAGKAVKQ